VNIVESVNQQILDFVQQPANRRLMPGTGAYSTPFRGTLFGVSEASAVAEKLNTQRVDALWLGSNPNVPRSLANILNPECGAGDFPDFLRQMRSGLFFSWRWDAQGKPSPDWNPIQQTTRRWSVYRDVLMRRFGSVDRVTMANCIPWGSKDTKEFISKLGESNPELLKRALAFADDLITGVITSLRPKVILVPFSFGKERQLDKVHHFSVARAEAVDCQECSIRTSRGRFRFFRASYRRGAFETTIAYVPHPAALRLPKADV